MRSLVVHMQTTLDNRIAKADGTLWEPFPWGEEMTWINGRFRAAPPAHHVRILARHQSPSRSRRRFSTDRSTSGDTLPNGWDPSRSTFSERTCSHMAKLTSRNPPSGGRTSTWIGRPRSRVVKGTATISRALP
jgi:hypothetical protein